MDVREKAVRYALSSLACENIMPNININDPLPLLEQELVEMVALYRGQEEAAEVKRQFVIASLS